MHIREFNIPLYCNKVKNPFCTKKKEHCIKTYAILSINFTNPLKHSNKWLAPDYIIGQLIEPLKTR